MLWMVMYAASWPFDCFVGRCVEPRGTRRLGGPEMEYGDLYGMRGVVDVKGSPTGLCRASAVSTTLSASEFRYERLPIGI